MTTAGLISLDLDTKKIEKFLDDVHNKAVRASIAPSLNKTIRKVNTKVAKELSQASGMIQRDVKRLLPLSLARHGQTSAAIVAKRNHRTPNLIRFKARETKHHLSAKAFGKSLKYKRGFIGNNDRTAFQRTGKSAHPIEALHGANPVRAFSSTKHHTKFVRYASTVLPFEFNRVLAYKLSRIQSRG